MQYSAMFNPANWFANASRHVRLRDGTDCLVRPLSGADRDLVLACFERLSPDSRRLRFFVAKSRLSRKELDFLTGADGHAYQALVAVRLNAWGLEEEALGFARCVCLKDAAESAEMSLAVADDVQRLGVGAALVDRLTVLARSRGIRHFAFEVLAENYAMRGLAARMGAVSQWKGDGTVEYAWMLPDTTADGDVAWRTDPRAALAESMGFFLSLFGQVIGIGIAYADAMLGRSADAVGFDSFRLPEGLPFAVGPTLIPPDKEPALGLSGQ